MTGGEVDPELLALAELMPKRSFSGATLEEDRAMMRAMWAKYQRPTGDGIAREERHVPGREGDPDILVIIYRPEKKVPGAGAILHIHGGGFIGGAAANTEGWNRAEAAALGCTVISVEYRLAPETPHPGPIEDCYAALKWLHGAAGELGFDANRIAVEGVSAGGALAAALSLLARDRCEVPIAFASLVYPMLDDRSANATPDPVTGHVGWTYESNGFGWKSLLGKDVCGPDVSPYASAARAMDLAGLPPTFIGVGALDMLVFENIDYARRLIAAGVPTQLMVYPRAFHGFDIGTARIGEDFKRDRLESLRRAIA